MPDLVQEISGGWMDAVELSKSFVKAWSRLWMVQRDDDLPVSASDEMTLAGSNDASCCAVVDLPSVRQQVRREDGLDVIAHL